jgi:MFS superfamily sulfate permease-like transporter
LNVDVGFYVGLGYSIILLIYKSQRPRTYLLGSVDDSDIYVPLNKYARAEEVRGVKIFQFCGPLNYADVNYFTSQLKTKSGFDIE